MGFHPGRRGHKLGPGMALTQRHTIYIRCRPAELWAALTEGQSTRKYYFDAEVESSFEPGATIHYKVEQNMEPMATDGVLELAIAGEIIAVEAERSLVHSFGFADLDEPATTVRWTLTAEAGPGVMRVDLSHEGLGEGSETWERVDAGWPGILSGLKTWLETGEALTLGDPPPEPLP